jgi:hypothetical protein
MHIVKKYVFKQWYEANQGTLKALVTIKLYIQW